MKKRRTNLPKPIRVTMKVCANCGEVKFCRSNGLCIACAAKLAEISKNVD